MSVEVRGISEIEIAIVIRTVEGFGVLRVRNRVPF
jgi:hypothetical protein